MTFIHKNVNSALLMLITFISVALVTATVYSVQAFDSINTAYSEKALQADELQKQLSENQAMADSFQQAAQLNQQREQALAAILQQKQEQPAEQAPQEKATSSGVPSKAAFKPASNTAAGGPTFNAGYGQSVKRKPYTSPFSMNWIPQKVYIA